jgi:putative membrane protein
MKKNSNFSFDKPIRQSYVAILMIVYKYYSIIIKQLVPLAIIFFIGKNKAATWTQYLLYFVVGVAIVSMIIAIIAYFRFYFHIVDDELLVEKGILIKKKTSIPFDRIQTINIEQNIVHQVFRVVRVVVDTAGSEKTEFQFEALSEEMANSLRNLILSRKSAMKKSDTKNLQQHDEEAYEEEEVRTIMNIGVGQLIKIGITENHLKSGALIFAFGWWIYDNLSEAGVDVNDYGESIDLSPTTSIILFLAVVFTVISILISLIRTVLMYFDLKFLRIGNGFRLTSGLLTKRNVAALDHKIQMVSFADNILKKILGYKDLLLKQASSIELANKKSIKIPGCLQEHIDLVTDSLYGKKSFDGIEYYEVDKRYFIRKAIYIVVFGSIPMIVGIYFENLLMWVGIALVMIYLLLVSYINYRKTKYGFNHKMIVVKGGVFGDKTTLFPLYKLQSAALKQNLYQRRKDLATVVLYTASGGTSIPYISRSTAEQLMNYFLYKVESDRRKWM